VVGDVKQEKLEVQPTFDIYLPWRQVIPEQVSWLRSTSFLVLRTNMPPMSLETALRKEIHSLDPTVPTTNIRTMEQVMGGALAARRFSLSLVGVFAVTALLLAAAGLYAVIAYLVSQRTREIGIRLALGAAPRHIMRLMMGQGMKLTLIGVAIGFVGAIAVTRLMRSLLFAVAPNDLTTFGISAIVLIVVALLACFIPARRATKVDPLVALRYE
jgi:ABC-type antimicrobial peptide transport system permease subunit